MFSTKHLAAFERYRSSGHSLASLDEAELSALCEDKAFGVDVARERKRRILDTAPAQTTTQATSRRERALTDPGEPTADESLLEWASRNPGAGTPLTAMVGLLQGVGDELTKLRAEIKELRDRPQLQFRGVWTATTLYARGDVTTWDGSMWHAQSASIGRKPGNDSSIWVLCVKRGRDGTR